LEKKYVKERDPKGTPKTLMPQTWIHKLDGGENLEDNFERDETTQLRG
jgi:hypothetical protein